jgi:outer membrane murein-binding lipoprotein Lpp
MATNTIVLIVVTVLAAVVLAGVLVGVAYKTRTPKRHATDTTIRDQAAEDALRLRRQQALADEYAARAQAAQVEIDIKTIRACRANGAAVEPRPADA